MSTPITNDQMEQIIELALGRYSDPGDRIDWDDLLYRIEATLDIDLPSDFSDPVIDTIRRAVRRARREAAE